MLLSLSGHRPRRPARSGARSLAIALGIAVVIGSGARGAHAQVCVPEGCLPPPNSAYTGSFHSHFNGAGVTVELSAAALHDFTSCSSPPPDSPGASTVIVFDALLDCLVGVNGVAPTPRQAPAHATMRVAFDHQSGSTRSYNLEMLALDIAGGTLPAGSMIRESPTLPSLGQANMQDLGGGNYRIDSFFDVFFELTLDGGVTWIPDATPPGHFGLTGPDCPTPARRNTWGAIKALYR